jgi:beta-glucosidase
MDNRTYRYYKGEALYPFGYGLSYSTFKYDSLQIPASVKTGEDLRVTARLKNTGSMKGEEVAQLYISYQDVNGKAPLKALKGFHRISFKPGESKTITFLLSPEDLSLVKEDGSLYQPKGKLMISVGGGQPGVKNKTTSNVISGTVTIL